MATDTSQVVTLFVFFFGVGLCMWRAPQGDRTHIKLCSIALILWCALLLFEPRTRTPGYGFIVMMLLLTELSRVFQRRVTKG